MSTTNDTAVRAALLRTATRRTITRAVEELWPDSKAVLGPQCPSVTSYVCRVTVDGQELIAKYGWLGLSLVSVLRGGGGTGEELRVGQRAYVRSSELLTAREARHLEALRQLEGLRVCETAGLRDGVLLTRRVTGMPLADAVWARPWETGELLDAVLLALAGLHGAAGAECLHGVAPIRERSVVGVFRRKFNGLSANAYLRALGRDRELPEYERQEIVELLRGRVRRLHRMAGAISFRRRTVVFGDLKPEHVFLDGSCLTFIDPALHWAAGPQPDIAKLTGRTALLAIGHHERRAAQEIVRGVVSTLARHIAALPAHERAARLREVLILWLMDTVNILTTCLSAPPDLSLAPHQRSLVARARTVAGVVDRVSALLVGPMTGSMAGLRLLEAVAA
ncbi:hypothetical protein AB0O07_03655 [Streptomyces sp. NPDC093085]|uniref:hypothetical protein n=1 Tax=Streptomyces sp. NPDC093085 TaxID=3155068 RepID=UPI003435CCE0